MIPFFGHFVAFGTEVAFDPVVSLRGTLATVQQSTAASTIAVSDGQDGARRESKLTLFWNGTQNLHMDGTYTMICTVDQIAPNDTWGYDEQDVTAPHSDEQLLLRYRELGSRDEFAQLVQRYERELYNYLRRYLGDAEMAHDVFQATFLQVHLKCDQFEEGRRFRPWLYTIATHQAIDAQRRNRRHRMVSLDRAGGSEGDETGTLSDLLVSGEPNPLRELDRQERRRTVRDSVAQLPETLRAVVVLVYYQGMKYREAADVLDIPVGTVKSRLHTAVNKLHEMWDDVLSPEM